MMARLSNAVIYAHEDEIPIIEGRQKAAKVGWRIPKPFNLEVMGLQTALNLGIGSHEPYKVSQRIKDGDRLGPLECIGVPGHTPGSMAFWIASRRALIVGDTVSTWPVNPEISWPTFDLDHEQAQRSVAKMASLSTVQIICVGHGNPILYGAADVLKQLANKKL
jgi:glyoxylase-like metal-dependent hydrolase (beta-lactamase superfamily II)